MKTRSRISAALVAGGIAASAALLAGCDKDVHTSKETTTKTTSTPDGTRKTTETTERKVETEHKDNR